MIDIFTPFLYMKHQLTQTTFHFLRFPDRQDLPSRCSREMKHTFLGTLGIQIELFGKATYVDSAFQGKMDDQIKKNLNNWLKLHSRR